MREADACKGDGDVAALLRREGLYSSLLSSWRRQRDEIAKVGMTSRKRGRKAKTELWDTRELHLVSLDYGGETREVGAIDINIDQDLVA